MPKPASSKLTEPLATWVQPSTAARIQEAARKLGWSPSQLVREAVEAQLPGIERAAQTLVDARRPK